MLAARKCYCNNCRTEFKFEDGSWDEDFCPVCGNTDPDYELYLIPEHETPKQYKKRTGKEWPSEAAVWFRIDKNKSTANFTWGVCRHITARKDKDICVCVTSPEPPPDDWFPEREERHGK